VRPSKVAVRFIFHPLTPSQSQFNIHRRITYDCYPLLLTLNESIKNCYTFPVSFYMPLPSLRNYAKRWKNVSLWRVRVTILVREKQEVLHILSVGL